MIKLFCDCADLEMIKNASKNPLISGFTTNPTLMAKAGITDYKKFVYDVTRHLSGVRPETCVSFEVFTDDITEMYTQAIAIHNEVYNSDFRKNVYIKIPVMNTNWVSTSEVIKKLNNENIPVNVTAVFTQNQAMDVVHAINPEVNNIISIFAGRLYDVGIDAKKDIEIIKRHINSIYMGPNNIQILWASPRQVYDFCLARDAGADIITMTPELIEKLKLLGKDPNYYSLDTIKMFYEDGKKAGFKI